MKTFLIQSEENGIPCHDFGFQMIKAVEFNKWCRYNSSPDYDYKLVEGFISKNNAYSSSPLLDYIPIGSVEFVLDWFQLNGINHVKPLNVPSFLFPYANREIYITDNIEALVEKENLKGEFIVKDHDKIKGFCDKVAFPELTCEGRGKISFKEGNHYFISEFIPDILAEWRCFIFNQKLLDVRHYLGDFRLQPDYNMLDHLLGYFGDKNAYTIDVGFSKTKGMIVIEIHDFFSCGLYGFNDAQKLPLMFLSTINKLLGKESR